MYASVTVFLETTLANVATAKSNNFISIILAEGYVSTFFEFFYGALIIMAVIFSLTTPIEKGIFYLKFIMVFFGLIVLLTLFGIFFYLG